MSYSDFTITLVHVYLYFWLTLLLHNISKNVVTCVTCELSGVEPVNNLLALVY